MRWPPKARFGATIGDQLGVDRNSESKNEDGYTMGSCLLRRVAVGDSPFSTGGAPQLVPE